MYAATAQMIYVQKWKEETVPTKEDWQKMEYAEMAKLMGRMKNQEEKTLNKEWGEIVDYLKNYCKQLKTLAGLT